MTGVSGVRSARIFTLKVLLPTTNPPSSRLKTTLTSLPRSELDLVNLILLQVAAEQLTGKMTEWLPWLSCW